RLSEWSKGGARESLIRRLAAYVGSVTQGFCKFFYKQKPGVELNYTRLPLSEPERQRRQHNKISRSPWRPAGEQNYGRRWTCCDQAERSVSEVQSGGKSGQSSLPMTTDRGTASKMTNS